MDRVVTVDGQGHTLIFPTPLGWRGTKLVLFLGADRAEAGAEIDAWRRAGLDVVEQSLDPAPAVQDLVDRMRAVTEVYLFASHGLEGRADVARAVQLVLEGDGEHPGRGEQGFRVIYLDACRLPPLADLPPIRRPVAGRPGGFTLAALVVALGATVTGGGGGRGRGRPPSRRSRAAAVVPATGPPDGDDRKPAYRP